MSALAKIKKAAAQHEHDRQYDKALAQYARLLDDGAGSDEEVDVTLYNRAGDLALRAGDVPRAVTYFERAIDLYAAGGFLNNAVALAVKILRHAPGHLAAHHTLGVLYGRKGFQAEARQHLADYAAQMHRAGRGEEVGRTLGELAALGTSPDEVAIVREFLTARAAGPEDAGALVKAFDAAVGPAARTAEPAAGVATAVAAIPLSELIEFEIRGPRLAPVAPESSGAASVRWTTALPGDVTSLRLSMLVASAAPLDIERLDLGAGTEPNRPAESDPLDLLATLGTAAESRHDADEASAAMFSLQPFELPSVELPSFEVIGFDMFDAGPSSAGGSASGVSDTDAFARDMSSVDPSGLDVGSVDLSSIDPSSSDLSLLGTPSTAHAMNDAHGDEEAASELPFIVDIAPPAAPRVAALLPDASASRAAVKQPLDDVDAIAAVEPADQEPMDLGAWLRATELPASTRLVTPAPVETGDERADFDAALHAFTAGIAHSVDVGDRESHYDLGIAFREMGLLSDAVREFQRALAAPGSGLREREALAQCFLDLGRPELALASLENTAVEAAATASSDTLIGVHYVLAEAARSVGRTDDARAWYVRVLASDYAFRDAATHLAALPPPRSSNRSR